MKTIANAAKDAFRRQRRAWLNAWCPSADFDWNTSLHDVRTFSNVHCSHAAALSSYTNVSPLASLFRVTYHSHRAFISLSVYTRVGAMFWCHAASVVSCPKRIHFINTLSRSRSLSLTRTQYQTKQPRIYALYAFRHASLPAYSRKCTSTLLYEMISLLGTYAW